MYQALSHVVQAAVCWPVPGPPEGDGPAIRSGKPLPLGGGTRLRFTCHRLAAVAVLAVAAVAQFAPAAHAATPPGTRCPGPQVSDATGDAPNNFAGGDGTNMENLDLVNAFFGTAGPGKLRVTITMNNLHPAPPPVNINEVYWTAFWSYAGTDYFAQAVANPPSSLVPDQYFQGGQDRAGAVAPERDHRQRQPRPGGPSRCSCASPASTAPL